MAEPRGDYTKERSAIDLEEGIPHEDTFEDDREVKSTSRLTAVPPADPSVVLSRSAPSSTPSASSPKPSGNTPSAGSLCTVKSMVIGVGGLLTFTATVATILGFLLDFQASLDFQATLNQDIVKATKNPTRLPTPPPTKNSTRLSTPPPTKNPTRLPTPPPTKKPTPLPTPPPTGKVVNIIMESLGDDGFKESKTGDSDWIDLTDDVQNSLTSLGYNQFAWDNAVPPSEYEMFYWNDLSPEQQNAAMTFFQEDEASWNGWVYETDKNGNIIYVNDWEEYGWSGLPQEIKDAMTVLGWDESAWNNGESVSTESMMWIELSSAQQDAAGLYGHNQQTWDAERTDDGQEEEEGELTMADYENMNWDGLPQEIKDAMTVLGWSKSAWNNGESVSTESTMWSELSSDQQNAAGLYGYNQQTWDVERTDDGQEEEEELTMADYENMNWNGLPQEIKDAMTVLGWSKSAWNLGESVSTESMIWSELSSDQQNAAGLYGYDQQTWDAAHNMR